MHATTTLLAAALLTTAASALPGVTLESREEPQFTGPWSGICLVAENRCKIDTPQRFADTVLDCMPQAGLGPAQAIQAAQDVACKVDGGVSGPFRSMS